MHFLLKGDVEVLSLGKNDNVLEEPLNVANLVWTISFTVIVIVGTCGNGIVLWIILGKSSSISSSNKARLKLLYLKYLEINVYSMGQKTCV